MNYSNYRFSLDIQSNLSQVSLPVKLNDTGRRLLIGLTDGGNPYHISEGSIAKFTFSTSEDSDGNQKVGMYDCVIEDNFSTIRFDLTSAVTGISGIVDCEIRLYGPNKRLLTSPRFSLVVNDRVIYDDNDFIPEDKKDTIDAFILYEAELRDNETARIEAENERNEAETVRQENEDERIAVTEAMQTGLENLLSEQEKFIKNDVTLLSLLDVYPIGSIYMSINNTDPSLLFGGTWEQLKDKFLLSAGDTYTAGSEGGSADAVLLKHKHNIMTSGDNPLYVKINKTADTSGYQLNAVYNSKEGYYASGAQSSTELHAGNPVNVQGGSSTSEGAGKNMPPYLAVYVWKRIA